MDHLANHLPNLALAYLAYLIATLSPGPANLAIVATSIRSGRAAGLYVAAGVVLGSLTWGILAALGLSTFMTSYGWAMEVLRIAGGLYLLWLAWKSIRSAIGNEPPALPDTGTRIAGSRFFYRGLAIHLTNPKSIFAWLAIIAIGVGPAAPAWMAAAIIAGCFMMGIVIFGGYAVVFSTGRMTRTYLSFRRWIDGTTAVVFGFAGLKLLTSRS